MKHLHRTITLIVFGAFMGALITSGLSLLTNQPSQKIVIAIQPTIAASDILQRAKPVETFLEERLAVDVEMYVPTSYAAVVEALRRGHAHAALMSAWPSYLAWKLSDAEVVLAEVRTVGSGDKIVNATHYFSYWVTLPDSSISSLEDLRGKKVGLPSPISTSGYVAPLSKLVEKGLVKVEGGKEADPSSFFTVVFTGGYAQSWKALQAGDVDAIVIAGDIPAELYFEVVAKTKVIDSQGPIPSHAVVFSKELKEPLRSKLIQAFIELGDRQPELMRSLVSALFVKFQLTTTEEHLSELARYLKLTNLRYLEKVG
ncbi:MAG: phosphate/phosphite/phosphonate ABC transporter substrate-binding protein [Candidatus Caldarchaeum sp.]|uniref:Phosphate/phosphite/phosphonate ABC transporter substrate-binding protein n=1 Tax=Caldiarchaeum subterraneum TaxID=311458 RepID=A0A7C5Q3M7_CALS0